MPVPALPGTGFVVGQTQLCFGGLERVLDCPALSLHPHQGLDRGTSRAPGREERQIPIRDGAPDQQASCPQAGEILVVFLRLEIGELNIGPVIQARSLGAVAGRQAPLADRIHLSLLQ